MSAAIAAVWGTQLAFQAVSSYRTLGAVSGYLIGALAAAAVTLAATPTASRRNARFAAERSPGRGAPFGARPSYYRLVLFALFGAFLGSIFGGRREAYPRFAVHLLSVLAFERICLCFPSGVQRVVEWIERHRLARALDLALTNAILVLGIAELGLRALLLVQGPLPWLPAENDPLASKLRAPIFGFAPNRLGYNDREFQTARMPGTLRVAALGDSFFVAHVPRPYGVIARTEELLNEAHSERPVELFNFGIVATNPTEYLEVLRRDALGFEPDAVMVGVYVGNDIKISRSLPNPFGKRWYALYQTVDRWRHAGDIEREVARAKFVDLTRIADGDREFWFSNRVPASHSREWYLDLAARHVEHVREPSSAYREKEWQSTLATLARIKQVCDGAGIPLWLVIEPDQVQVSRALRVAANADVEGDLRYPQRRLLSFAADRGIPALDLLPAFESADDPDALYLPNDNHWSAPGNELAARTLAAWLAKTLG